MSRKPKSNKRDRASLPYQEEMLPAEPRSSPIRALTPAQGRYLNLLRSKKIVYAIGSAGSGKSFIAGSWAANQLVDKKCDKVVLTRAMVEASGEKMGFLPGEVKDKYEPYVEPYRDVFEERLGIGFTKYLTSSQRIVGAPMAYMRSKTYKNCIVIISEAQNATPEQMYLLLTRLGDNSQLIIEGDDNQKDIRGVSGLSHSLSMIGHLDFVGVVKFGIDDCVRSEEVKQIMFAYLDKGRS